MTRDSEDSNPPRPRRMFLIRDEGASRRARVGCPSLLPLPPSRRRAALALKSIHYICLGLALICLGYVALNYSQAGVFQAYQGWKFDRELERRASSPGTAPATAERASPYPPAIGSILGRMEIPRIGLGEMVIEGDDEAVLRKGPGHLPASAFPGGPGNVVFAAHRDTFFRALHNIRRGDEITVTTTRGVYKYQVDFINEVSPQDVQVLKARRHPTLTLITCYPFYFVGDAPQRFVVQASELQSSQSLPPTAASDAQPAPK